MGANRVTMADKLDVMVRDAGANLGLIHLGSRLNKRTFNRSRVTLLYRGTIRQVIRGLFEFVEEPQEKDDADP